VLKVKHTKVKVFGLKATEAQLILTVVVNVEAEVKLNTA
jgi:hypothetical protein